MAKNNRLARRSTDRRADGRGAAMVLGILPTNGVVVSITSPLFKFLESFIKECLR
jgi:hypothetical protein